MHTEKVVAEYFEIQSQFLSTRFANAYKAVDRSRNAPVTLWLSRDTFDLNSPNVGVFLESMKRIQDIRPPIADVIAYGVDAAGVAFFLSPPLYGHVVTAGNMELGEAERRYMSCLTMVSRLHSIDLACGDISPSSFWIHRAGNLGLVGLIGACLTPDTGAGAVSPENLPFVAPEQIQGAKKDTAADVFGLGVLGYSMFTGKYPYGEAEELQDKTFDLATVPKMSEFVDVPPVWADEVLRKCIDPSPSGRYRGAAEILAAIQQARERSLEEQALPAPKITSAPKLTKPAGSSIEEFQKASLPVMVERAPEEVQSRRVLIIATVLVIILIGAIVPFLFLDKTAELTKNGLEQELKPHRDAVTDENLKLAIDTLTEEDKQLNEKAAQLKKIAESDDPLAHDILMKSAEDAPSQKMRELSERALVERTRRLGLTRSAEQIHQWLRTLRPGQYPANYSPLLRSTNKSFPQEVRFSSLRQAYATDPVVALRLTVALALDLEDLKGFQSLISQLVGDSLQLTGLKDYSALSLILAHPDLALVFGEDIIQKRNDIPSDDILWLLKILAKRNDINVRAIASLGVERSVLSSVKQIFLQMIRDRADLPPDVTNALIRSAADIVDKDDIRSFGRWYDVAAETVLLALLVDVDDIDLLRDIFDTLAGKSLSIEPSASLIKWIRTNYWEDRADFAKVVGVLGNIDTLKDEEVVKAFTAFDTAVRDSDLLDILLDTNHPIVVKTVVSKYADLLGLGTLLNLLDFPDKTVRITAVKSLKGFNDIGALKLIIDYYEKEKDEDVRKVYQDTFWVIKKREQEGSSGFGL